ncbi:phasin family protein [Primorskyibacter aestuariivivens]|uniref:phasin family protein n=1 Tax=Primorskyibacter aestuariivivens TaxID=1888912 RepID=UPI002300E336|nr:phasin family protein [Primorskyibacter aestuariivivens]MDA7429081.1 phasin family protein [Primorskyibacter aestuariivivens]
MTKTDSSNPYHHFLKMFDPANLTKAFDPKAMIEKFAAIPGIPDAQDTLEKSKSQFEALARANEAAAQSYRDLMEKQMKIFQDLTAKAAEQAKAGSQQDVTAYQQAVDRALELMTELSDAACDANKQAYDTIEAQVAEAMKNLKP